MMLLCDLLSLSQGICKDWNRLGSSAGIRLALRRIALSLQREPHAIRPRWYPILECRQATLAQLSGSCGRQATLRGLVLRWGSWILHNESISCRLRVLHACSECKQIGRYEFQTSLVRQRPRRGLWVWYGRVSAVCQIHGSLLPWLLLPSRAHSWRVIVVSCSHKYMSKVSRIFCLWRHLQSFVLCRCHATCRSTCCVDPNTNTCVEYEDLSDVCKSHCLNSGRYCSPNFATADPAGFTGQDIVKEDLRQVVLHPLVHVLRRYHGVSTTW